MIRIDVTNQNKIDDAGVLPFGIIADEISFFEISQTLDDAVDHLIDAHHLADHGPEFGKEGMFGVGHVEDLAAGFLGLQELGLLELVEFLADGIGGNVELLGQFTKVGPGCRIEKKSHQQLDAGFR